MFENRVWVRKLKAVAKGQKAEMVLWSFRLEVLSEMQASDEKVRMGEASLISVAFHCIDYH